jgi:uncharacterized protein YcaQ
MTFTSNPIQISKQTARRFLLDHQFLLPPRCIQPNEIVHKIFERLGCIQFDTINVVGRNADLVLQSRVLGYSPDILEDLLYQERTLIDGWDKMASIYQTTDWPFFKRRREQMRKSHHLRSDEASEAAPGILAAIREKGPLSSIDFKDARKTDWWWAPTSVSRAAMETLYASGDLGIAHRVNTRRVFDLIERLIPNGLLITPDPHASEQEYVEWHLLRRLGSIGFNSLSSGEYWYGIAGGNKAAVRKKGIVNLQEKGLVKSVRVNKLPHLELYGRTEDLAAIDTLPEGEIQNGKAAFIAPLDNLIWNRKLIEELFGFSYTWEVYKPKAKREYGYYVLPVLYQDQFIARVDLKFDRNTNILNLVNWWWEEGVTRTPQMEQAIQDAFREFLAYLGGDQIKILRENFVARGQASFFETLTGDLQ